jgi:hypothetical protein
MSKIIQYAIHKDDGLVISRVGNEVAWPVLEYEKIGAGGDFTQPLTYTLEKFPVLTIRGGDWQRLRWTKKIPRDIKNLHRAFWGLPALEGPPTSYE